MERRHGNLAMKEKHSSFVGNTAGPGSYGALGLQDILSGWMFWKVSFWSA